MKKYLLSLFFLCTLIMYGQAQKTVSGTVTDVQNEPLPGVTVVLKSDQSRGTITDINGKYALAVPEDATLIISFIGMQTQEISVAGQTIVNVVMKADMIGIDEVVAVGYGVQKKSDLTGAVASVKGDALAAQPVASTEALMQGRAAGVQVTSTSGAPGAGVSVRIRGTGTVGNAAPLYVVDGILTDDISSLNSNDIENIEVLKDASSTAIYGSRGANGVIIVTTKNGKSGSNVITYDGMYGIQNAWKKPDLLNTEEWYDVINMARYNGGLTPFNLVSPANDLNHTTDWFDEVTRTGQVQSHNVSFSGGNEKTNYLISSGYFQEKGIVEKSDYDRLTFRMNVDSKMKDWIKVGARLNLAHSKRHVVPSDYYNGVINVAQKLDPATPIMDVEGNYISSPYTDVKNPIAALDRDINRRKYLTILGNSYVELEPVKGLTFKSSFSVELRRDFTHSYTPAYNLAPDERQDKSVVSKSTSNYDGWLWENTITYNKAINQHDLTLLAGYTAEENYSEWMTGQKQNTPGDDDELQYLDAATEGDLVFNSGVENSMYSFLGRLNYSYADKYLLTASVRRDGSSVFGPGKRFGTFPSASLGWKLLTESFMDFIPRNIFSSMKLRAGWGQVGNAKIGAYGYTSTVSTNAEWAYSHAYVFNDKVVSGAAANTIANKDIQWETVESTNIGLDMGLLDYQLTASFDYFIKKTKDMLLRVPLPVYAGYYSNPYSNIGSVENKGFEITLGYRNSNSKAFNYSVNVNASHIENEVTSIGTGQPISGGSFRAFNTTRTEVGHPIGEFYGYVVDGVFQDDAEVAAGYQPGAVPGDFRFKDVNGDKAITSEDRTFIGSPHPDWFYGITFNAEYKQFDLNLFLQGVQGVDVFNAQKWYTMAPNTTTAKSREILEYWYPGSGINDMFGLNAGSSNNNLRESTFFIEDGSYLRLKNIQLGYTFKNAKDWWSNLRVYVSAQNLLTLTKYSGLDPEIGGGTTNTGLDYGTYPQARVISFGVSLKL